MEAQTNTQMPQPACHLSADRRNTPATSFQSAFHHSVTTCQLQSPSLRHTALIFSNCAAAWDTTQPCQKYDNGRITLLHLLAHSHAHVLTLTLLHTCTCVRPHLKVLLYEWWTWGFRTKPRSLPSISCWSDELGLVYVAIRLNYFCFCCASRKEKLGTLLYMISGMLPEPPVRQNDSLIYWLTDSANSPYIHSKLIPQATRKNYYSATTHIYAPEAKSRRLGAETAAMGEWRGVCFSFVLRVLNAHIFQVALSIVS